MFLNFLIFWKGLFRKIYVKKINEVDISLFVYVICGCFIVYWVEMISKWFNYIIKEV